MALEGTLASFAMVAFSAAATWCDARAGKIPNRLTAAMVVAGLVFRAAEGSAMVIDGVLGATLGLAIGLLLFGAGVLGAGDGKLLIGVGAFFGLDRFVGALALIALLGGLLGLAIATRRGIVLPALLNVRRVMRGWLAFGRPHDAGAPIPCGATVPYGVAIAAGAILSWFWGGPVL